VQRLQRGRETSKEFGWPSQLLVSFVNVGRKGRNKQAPEKRRKKKFFRRSKKEREEGGRKGIKGRDGEEKLKRRK